jgi:hypothetical protein
VRGCRGLTRTTTKWRGVPRGATFRAPFLRSAVCVDLCIVLRIVRLSVQIMFAGLYPPLHPVQPSPACTSTHPRPLTSLHHTAIPRHGSRTRDEGVKRNRSCIHVRSAEHPRGGSTPSAPHRLSHPVREKRMIANAPVSSYPLRCRATGGLAHKDRSPFETSCREWPSYALPRPHEAPTPDTFLTPSPRRGRLFAGCVGNAS